MADASDAEAALSQAEDLQPDVIVTDIGLPGSCDGVGFASRLHAREKTADIPVVAITGRSLRDFDGAGFVEVLQKPILPDALIASVRSALDTSRDLRARSARVHERVPALRAKSTRLLEKARGLADRMNSRTKP